MKKIISLLLAVFMLLSLLAGCGDNDAQEDPANATDVSDATEPEVTEPEATEPEDTESEETEPATAETEETEPEKGFEIPDISDDAVTINYPVTSVVYYTPSEFTNVVSIDDSNTSYSSEDGTASLNVQIQETSKSALNVDADQFAADMSTIISEFQLIDYRLIDIDGAESVYAEYTGIISGIACHVYNYIVVTNDMYTFTYLDSTADNRWTDEIVASAATIKLLHDEEVLAADVTDLELYDLGGLEMYASPDFNESSAVGFTALLDSSSAAIWFLEEPKDTLGTDVTSLSDYAAKVAETNGLHDFYYDYYDNLCTTLVLPGSDGNNYLYLVAVKETADSYWLLQCAMPVYNCMETFDQAAQWFSTAGEKAITDDDRIYMIPGDEWDYGNVYFATYFFDSKGVLDPVWVEMTWAGNGYSVTVPEGYDNAIFCRMDAGFMYIDWDYRLNQTADLPLEGNMGKVYIIMPGDSGYWIER